MQLGERIKKLREDRGLTQADVCAAINISQSTLANYETNFRTPKMDVLISLANFYKVSLDYLLGRTETPFPINAKKIPNDLNKFLQQSEIVFDGDAYNLDDEERAMVMQSLKVAFYAAKKANKRKKDDTHK